MARPHGQAPRVRGGALGLLVLGLHLALGLALQQLLLRHAPHGPAAAMPVHVWITRTGPDQPAPPARPDRAARLPHQTAPRPHELPPRPARRAEPQAIGLPPPAPVSGAAPPAPATAEAPAPGPSAPAPPAPLNLALPGRPASAPVPHAWTRQDPRVHDAPQDAGERMARTLGTDLTLRTARRGDGFELRRGGDCVQVQPSRAGQIFMPDGSARPPSQVGRC